MTAQLPSTEYTLEDLREIAYRGSYDDMQRNLARALLAAHEQEPVAYSLIFRNMDGVLNSDINTNTTFATREKAEAYGRGGRYETQPDGSLKWVADENLDPVVVPLYAHPAPVHAVPDERYQHLSELYHSQEKRLFKLAQRIKGPSFDKYAYSTSQAIDVLEAAIFGESEDESRAAMLNGGKSTRDEWRSSLQELVKAMRDYEMDVGEPAPYKHREMMRRAEALLNGSKS